MKKCLHSVLILLFVFFISPSWAQPSKKSAFDLFDEDNSSNNFSLAAAENNLLLNPGFELTVLTPWQYSGLPPFLDPNSFEGNFAARKIILALSMQEYFGNLFQRVKFPGGGLYPQGTPFYVTAMIKTNYLQTTHNRAGLLIMFFNNQGQLIKAGSQPIEFKDETGGQTPDWTQLYVAGKTPTGTKEISVGLFDFSLYPESTIEGEAFFDNIVLSLEPIPAPVVLTLANTGFENGNSGWDFVGSPGVIQSKTLFKDTFSLQFSVDQKNYFGAYTQTLDIDPVKKKKGKDVHVRSFVKTVSKSGMTAGVILQYIDKDGFVIKEHKKELKGTHNWKKVQFTKGIPKNAVKMRFEVFTFNSLTAGINSQAFFDNVLLEYK